LKLQNCIAAGFVSQLVVGEVTCGAYEYLYIGSLLLAMTGEPKVLHRVDEN
jgi:hypothetical protein